MTYYSKYMERLKTAIEKFRFHKHGTVTENGKLVWKPVQRPIVSINDLLNAITLRATTEIQMREVVRVICGLLEPPACQKCHCSHHTTYSFCDCSVNKVPGRCKEHREYIKRKKLRKMRHKVFFGNSALFILWGNIV